MSAPPTVLGSLAIALALVTPGCFLFGGSSPVDVREYDLLPARRSRTLALLATSSTIQVEPLGVSESLDRESIVWRRGEVELGSYSDHRWARPPQQAVREVLAAALRAALARAVVATEPALASPEVVLRAHLARCEEVDDGDRFLGAVELRVVLARRGGAELLRKTYAGEEPALARNPPEVVAAIRRVAARIADDVAQDVATALSPREGR